MNGSAMSRRDAVYAKLTLIAYSVPRRTNRGLIMRQYILLAGTTLLAACGGAGTQALNSAPNPLGNGSVQPASTHTFAKPTDPKTYTAVGGSQIYDYLTDERDCCNQQGAVYSGNATTVRNSTIEITYDPRDAIFTLVLQDPLSRAKTNTRFQDPTSRTDFDGALDPQWGTPNLNNPNITYLQSGTGVPVSGNHYSGTGFIDPGDNNTLPSGKAGSSYTATSMFYLKPGTETQYVTYAGYLRNDFSWSDMTSGTATFLGNKNRLERGAFAYGENTPTDNVPKVGSGSFTGSMLGSMIFNPTIDGQNANGSPTTVLPSYFQWIQGTAQLAVNFAASAFDLTLNGTVFAPQLDNNTAPATSVLLAGATFNAAGKGTINMVNFGGFKGQFQSASFANPGASAISVNVEGSSIDGTFYGPAAQEAGGGFRIVGGNPDERVDIIGAFVGKK